MRPGVAPPLLPFAIPQLDDDEGDNGAAAFSAGPLLFLPLLFLQAGGAGMDLSKVGEKLLSSVRSARSLGLLPSSASDRPEVPARAAAAAAVARAIAGLPPHQRIALSSGSEELSSIYGITPNGQAVAEPEEDFYLEEFDPVRYVLEHIPSDESDAPFFEEKAALRLAQLDKITERLSRHVMEHHEEMVKGMQLVTELEQDLKVANVICMNGRRHIISARQEVSRDLVVNSYSKKKKALQDMIPILMELRHSSDMRIALDRFVNDGNYYQAFQVLPEYLQVLENYSELSAIQEMGSGVETWLAGTVQKLDALLLGVCQMFKEENYLTAVDAYALLGDNSGLAEKIQSYFMQEVLSETQSVLKNILYEEFGSNAQRNRLTYSDLCIQIPESMFRICLLSTLDALFKLMCSYYLIMSFRPDGKAGEKEDNVHDSSSKGLDEINRPHDCTGISQENNVLSPEIIASSSSSEVDATGIPQSQALASDGCCDEAGSVSPFYQLRKDAIMYVSQTLQRGRRNLWQLMTSRVSVLLSSSAACSTSTYQFLKNYEDLCVFILAGEAFCGYEAVEFRQRLKTVCENYVLALHRQNICALKMVLEKESWAKMTADPLQVINLAGLSGDGAPLIAHSGGKFSPVSMPQSNKVSQVLMAGKNSGFLYWLRIENPFSSKVSFSSEESPKAQNNDSAISTLSDGSVPGYAQNNTRDHSRTHINGHSALEDESEDLLADFIDEDSQLPSRISKPIHRKNSTGNGNDEEITEQTGSSLCLLRLMDKYARLMQKLEIVNIEFFKGICQLFGIFFHFIFETFGQREATQSGKVLSDSLPPRLKTTLSKIMQDCDQWIRPQNAVNSSSSPVSIKGSIDVLPTVPSSTFFAHPPSTSFGLKERCTGASTISLVARILQRSKPHLQSMLSQNFTAIVEDFYGNLVDSVPDLTEHIHRTTARMLLHINGYADRIANAKWEVKELGLEHNGYVDLLLGEFKHYKTRLQHGGISQELQVLLLEYGLESVAETLIEGLSRVKKCTDEGRVLMSLDLQVLINGLHHFVSVNVKSKLQVVETFIKAYYLPETEYVHWARSHPEFSKNQIVALVNLVANMKGWKRKTRLEVLERIESGT